MTQDRTLLFLMLLGVLAMIAQVPPPIRDTLGLVAGVQVLRSHKRAVQTVPVRRR